TRGCWWRWWAAYARWPGFGLRCTSALNSRWRRSTCGRRGGISRPRMNRRHDTEALKGRSPMSSSDLTIAWCAPGRGAPLGPELGRGGEAHIYGYGNGAAKIYRTEILRDATRRQQLRAKVEA